jgi:uncharacterized protein YqgV (UPF0045/DUF77 family)
LVFLEIIKKVREKCFQEGAVAILANIKVEWLKDKDASMEEKTGKYR